MDARKILIVSHLIFPAQLPRAHRATELALELARQGHNVTLCAVIGNYDYSRFELEYGIKVKNLGKLFFSNVNSDGVKKENLIMRVLRKLLHRMIEFPEIELMFKIPRIIKTEARFDLLISIAKPYPIHWGCALSKTKYRKSFPDKWIADCGDPYMGHGGAENKKPFYFSYVEKWFCRLADFIVIPFEGAKEGYYKEFWYKIRVIPQGFRFDNIILSNNQVKHEIPHFAYSGIFDRKIRNPSNFLHYLSSIEKDFKFVIYTPDDDLLKPFQKILGTKIDIRSYIPREKLLYELSKMDFLVNFENKTKVHLPSKLIDYALVKRPILSISADRLQEEIITEFLNGDYHRQLIINNVERFNISEVAKQFLSL